MKCKSCFIFRYFEIVSLLLFLTHVVFPIFRYITVGCEAMKLILKNFGSVIRANIDSPMQTVGVDISREER